MKSFKLTLLTRSTMEAEFLALAKCGEEVEWLRNFVEDIAEWTKHVSHICIHYDSQSTIRRAKTALYIYNSRHIRRRHNIIQQLLSTRVVSIGYVRSKDNIADSLIKGLNEIK